jgi:hypothetical protein
MLIAILKACKPCIAPKEDTKRTQRQVLTYLCCRLLCRGVAGRDREQESGLSDILHAAQIQGWDGHGVPSWRRILGYQLCLLRKGGDGDVERRLWGPIT